jgi:putative tricarboxylic transport membrane protein
MYDLVSNLAMGFGVAVTPTNIMLVMIGALVGTLIGVLPGIGSLATIAMLLPITFGLPPVGALIMLAGISLAIAAIGSFFAGCVATVLVAALGAPLTAAALLFGPAEYFSLMVLGLIFAVVLAKGSILKALTMILTWK